MTLTKEMNAGNKRSDTLFVASLEKGFRVLRAFSKGHRELNLRDLSLAEIARISGLDKSAAQRFTNTLVQLGYLDKDPQTRRYRPAVGLADFYFAYVLCNRLAESAMPRLIEASKIYNTTVNLCVRDGTEIIYTIRVPNEKATFPATIAGRRMPAYCTAGGVVMLAHSPAETVEDVLANSERKARTSKTVWCVGVLFEVAFPA